MSKSKLEECTEQLLDASRYLAFHEQGALDLFRQLAGEADLLGPASFVAFFAESYLKQAEIAEFIQEYYPEAQAINFQQFVHMFYRREGQKIKNEYEPKKLLKEILIRECSLSEKVRSEPIGGLPQQLQSLLRRKIRPAMSNVLTCSGQPDILVESQVRFEQDEPAAGTCALPQTHRQEGSVVQLKDLKSKLLAQFEADAGSIKKRLVLDFEKEVTQRLAKFKRQVDETVLQGLSKLNTSKDKFVPRTAESTTYQRMYPEVKRASPTTQRKSPPPVVKPSSSYRLPTSASLTRDYELALRSTYRGTSKERYRPYSELWRGEKRESLFGYY